MSGRLIYLNGEIVPSEAARVIPADRGLLYGDGLYETIRVRHGRPVRIESHAARLAAGAGLLHIDLEGFDLQLAVERVLEANGLADARVRATVTRGDQSRFPGGPATVIVTAEPLQDHPPEPVSTVIATLRRDELSPLTRVKTLNCLIGVVSLLEARSRGADDAIILNNAGRLAEATTANVFIITGTRLVTPPPEEGCLPGTVRAAVLDLAPALGFEPVEVPVEPAETLSADEVFLTSAIRLPRPVCAIDGHAIGTRVYQGCLRVREALLETE